MAFFVLADMDKRRATYRTIGQVVLELGVLLVDEELTTEEWRDPARDITKIKFRERYCFGILNEGESVAVLRNIHNVPNKIIDEPARPHYNVDITVADIPKKTPISMT